MFKITSYRKDKSSNSVFYETEEQAIHWVEAICKGFGFDVERTSVNEWKLSNGVVIKLEET